MKKILICLLVISMLVVSGCAQTTAPTTSTGTSSSGATAAKTTSATDAPKKKITLTFGWWGSILRNDKMNAILDLYQESNSHITIEREFAAYSDYLEKLAMQMAGGNATDIINSSGLFASPYATTNQIIPMDPFVDSGLIDLNDWSDLAIETGKFQDKLYMITYGTGGSCLSYNQSMIERAGMALPNIDWNVDEFKDYVVQLQSKLEPGTYALTPGLSNDQYFYSWVRSYGYEITDGKKITAPTSVIVDWFTYWNDLDKLGVLPAADLWAQESAKDWEESMQVKNTACMQFRPMNHVPILQTYSEDTFNVVRIPKIPNADNARNEYIQNVGMCITSKSKYPEECAKLINFIVNDQEAQVIYNLDMGFPGNKKVISEWLVGKLPAGFDKIQNLNDIILADKDVSPAVFFPATFSSFMPSELISASDKVSFGQLSPQAAAEEFVKSANALLS